MGFLGKRLPERSTGWHPGFAQLVIERGPSWFDVQPEVTFSQRPRRADLLLLRRLELDHGENRERPAQTLRGLWPLLSRVGIVEFKSPSREFRRGDLLKLCSYGFEYLQLTWNEFISPDELSLVLVTPSITPALHAEVGFLGAQLEVLGNGYARLGDGVHFLPTIIVATDEVAPAENDAYLSLFSHKTLEDREAARWFSRWLAREVRIMGDPKRIDDLDEILRKLYEMYPPYEVLSRTGANMERWFSLATPEERLAGLSTEDRLAGLSKEERLAGLSKEERLAGLSKEERLAGLSKEELQLLVAEAQRRLHQDE